MKHQPRVFDPYFAKGAAPDLAQRISEREDLLRKGNLSALEKKRLFDLNDAEMRSVRPSTDRYQALTVENMSLLPDITAIVKELDQIVEQSRADFSNVKIPNSTFQNPALKKAYAQAQQLWNKEQNDAALSKVNEILAGGQLNGASKEEIFKVQNLRFRIGMDLGSEAIIKESYEKMVALDACAPETAHGGLILAFRLMVQGDPKAAHDLFAGQCDPDTSAVNLARRRYWLARFSEGVANEAFEQCIEPEVPGYYSLLAEARLRSVISLPERFRTGALNFPEFNVGGDVHRLLSSAEERIAVGLRRDAAKYPSVASAKLREQVNQDTLEPALYTATLLQASGNHLEAMKIYSAAQAYFASKEYAQSKGTQIRGELLARMYPMPYRADVEWLARTWSVDPDFVYAIMRQESAFNPEAVSSTGARGLMQLMPFVARQISSQFKNQEIFSDRMLYAPDENLRIAIYYIHQLNEILPHPALVAAAYNAGFNRVLAWMKKFGWLPLDAFIETIPINETRGYVKLVMRNYVYYKGLRTGQPVDGKILFDALPYVYARR